jgi:hypothetical protein
MESVSTLWFEAWIKHLNQMREAKRCGQPTDGFSRAAMIAHMEYRCAMAIEIMEAKKP